MKIQNTLRWILAAAVLFGMVRRAGAQSTVDYAVQASAVVQTNPAAVILTWLGDSDATGYEVFRKLRGDLGFGSWQELTPASLAANVTNYTDSNVTNGGAYDYYINKDSSFASVNGNADGYIYAGIQLAPVEFRGKVVLIVDNRFQTSLTNELATLQQDLVGDGWTVLLHYVPTEAVDPANTNPNVWAGRSNELAAVESLITSDYNSDPTNVAAVFLFGHVPVPYSGVLAPDAHPDHVGAWPADGWYGSTNATLYSSTSPAWTDSAQSTATDNPQPGDARNDNLPGDGKLDQNAFPSLLTLQVGRVDMANLPSFSSSETELLRQYLNKDHNFRQKLVTVQERGLIDDNLGLQSGPEPVAAGAWRDFSAFFGPGGIVAGSWFPALTNSGYLWAYGCGSGSFTSCSGVATVQQLRSSDLQAVFTMMFGSYFGDWDVEDQDSLLKAILATPTYTLTSAWSARPNWICYHMGLGETIGAAALTTQNNTANLGTYDYDYADPVVYPASVSISLMGDPTLRMHIVAPPSALTLTPHGASGINLVWSPSPEAVAGYYVYRAATSAGPFTRLGGLMTGTNYSDSVSGSGNTYMVRALQLHVGASGSYFNLSQGAFSTLAGPFAHGDRLIANRSYYKGNGVVLQVQAGGNAQLLANTWVKDPYSLAFDTNGDILVADYQAGNGSFDGGVFKIDRIQPGNAPVAVSTNASFVTPFGLAVEPDGHILVADLDANGSGAVFRVDETTGLASTLATGGLFFWLGGITVANNGGTETILVTDHGDGTPSHLPKLISIDPATGAQTLLSSGGLFVNPDGLAVDPGGGAATNIIVANVFTNSTVTNGYLIAVTTNSTSGGWKQTKITTNAPFLYPTHVAIDPSSGRYLVTDGNPTPSTPSNFQGAGALYEVDPKTFSVTLLSTNGFFEQPRGIIIQP